ncbi:Rhomboid family protein [Desulfurococcus amylolyticus 1221n]|uniref:Rhomboid family protein n=1 Tax=Desulfurococcus amylolyticus (strain DSM 18924 / JCM 16383 / VKM B-2413 / 1221n) TaxID=490899 RepID=B8D2L0_DESA1|nr:rhomboid family intramembrane serine protease [Desulfurococcus amylolyticus]ACL10598.1 Rhomboid family protein [Desulfurococcus amylolyticus 1221n]
MVVVPGERIHVRGSSRVTILIILVNVLVYFYTSYPNLFLESTNESIYLLGFTPATLFTNPLQGVARIFTAMFTHAGLFHIFFNMYFLWLFGRRVESIIGSWRYLLLYLTSGIAAVLFHVAIIPVGGYDSLVVPAVGASGAISGVLGSYLLMFPNTRLMWCMSFLFLPYCFPVSTSVFLLIWFAEQVLYGYLRLGGVAYFAHVGGFVAGIALTYIATKSIIEQYKSSYTYDYIYGWLEEIGIVFRRPRGLGKIAKTILTVLLLLVAAGFAYGLYFINTTPPLTYLLNVSANGSNDTVSLVVYQGSVDVSYSSVDSVRILLNRLTPVLYNPSLANTSETYDKNYNVNIQGIRVPIHLRMNAVYDEVGVMRYGSGEMYTRVVNIDMYGNAVIGDAISIDFVLDSMRLNTVPFLSIGGVLALGITIYSVLSLRRADEIAMVTEEAPSLPYY